MGAKQRHARNRGQSLVTVALALPVIIALLALVIDLGNGYFLRRRMQAAADAGAMAGARALAVGQDADAAGQHYASLNGAQSAEVSIDPTQGIVSVTAQAQTPTFFGGLIGVNSLTAGIRSSARIGGVTDMAGGVFPIAVNWREDYGEAGTVWDILCGVGYGNFGWLGWDGCTNTPCLARNLTPPGHSEDYSNPDNPSDRTLSIGNWVSGSTGVKNAAAVRNALNILISTHTKVVIIAFDAYRGTGSNLCYRIRGFPAFEVTGYDLPRNQISGRFIEMTVPTTKVSFTAGFGVYGAKLVQ